MTNFRHLCACSLMALGWTLGLLAADPCSVSVTSVRQRAPWDGMVDISFTIAGEANALFNPVFTAVDVAGGTNLVMNTFLREDGKLASGTGELLKPGSYNWRWVVNRDLEADAILPEVRIRIDLIDPVYMVVDMSEGASAWYYPVSFLSAVPSGGWTDVYKTTRMVLRRLQPSGTFTMGDLVHGGAKYTNIRLTKQFYIGVFEFTQRQLELLDGANHSASFSVGYATRPAQRFGYNDVRGANKGAQWPKSKDVDESSLVGKLRARTRYNFDLPTEAQWEYACRAGKATDYNSGKNYTTETKDANMAAVGRYWHNGGSDFSKYASSTEAYANMPLSGGTAKVGSYAVNAWGLYDMHGNMAELCLDWYGSLAASKTDPVGPSSGTMRVVRGGSWYKSDANQCTSGYRASSPPSGDSDGNGARDHHIGVRFAVTLE